MFLFTLKKSFFNFWDNLFRIFFLNLGFVIVLVLTAPVYFLVSVFPYADNLKIIITSVIMIFIFNVYNGAVHGMVRDIADYKSP